MRYQALVRRAAIPLSVLVLAGCGGGSHPSANVHPGFGRRLPYRWLIPTDGPAPSIAAENRVPGSTAWRLPGPPADVGGLAQGSLRGYAAPETVRAGQTLRIAADAPGARRLRIAVFRMGWYGGSGGHEVLISRSLPVRRQPPCAHVAATGLTSCRWRASLAVRIPPALPSGIYIAKLTARGSGQSDVLFVVEAPRPAPLLAMLGTATYEAYNGWGGDSLYPGGVDVVATTGTTQGIAVSFRRPYDSVTGAGQFFARDVAMVRFLERYGLPASYTSSEGVEADPAQVSRARAVLDFGHSEYWSARGAQAFAAARDHGVNLLFLSSDTMAWRIRYADGGRTIVAYKEHAALDPDRTQPSGSFGAAAAALTGSRYLGCILPRIGRAGPPTYALADWHPSPRLQPGWLYRGTGLSATSTIPGIVGYELDATGPGTPAGTTTVGGGSASCMAAAPGEPAPPPGPGQATTTVYTAASGAFVFGSGTLSWELGLEPVPSASPQAPSTPSPPLVRLTLNLMRRAVGRG